MTTIAVVKLYIDEGYPSGALLNAGSATIALSARTPVPGNDVIAGTVPLKVTFAGGDTAPFVNVFPNDLIGEQGDDGPGTHYTITYSGMMPIIQQWTFQIMSADGPEQYLSHKTANPSPADYLNFLPRTTGTPTEGQVPAFTGDGYATVPLTLGSIDGGAL